MNLDLESSFNKSMHKAALSIMEGLKQLDDSTHVLSRRIVQILFTHNHVHILNALREKNNLQNETDLQNFITQEARSVSPLLLLSNLLKFIFFWILGFFYICYASLLPKSNNRKLVLIESPIGTFSDPQVFFDNINSEVLTSLSSLPLLVIAKDNKYQKINPNYILTPRPLFDSARFIQINLNDLLVFFNAQFHIAYILLRSIFIEPRVLLITKDFLSYPYIKMMAHSDRLVGILKTNSEYNDQQFWLEDKGKNFKFAFFWYSLNTITLKIKNHEQYDWYPYHLIYLEDSYTWSKTHAQWLDQFSRGTTYITEPLVFHKNGSFKKPAREYIILFDVPPVSTKVLSSIYLYPQDCFYSEENVTRFILDIIQAKDELKLEVDILIKSKRPKSIHHRKGYFEMLEELASQGKIVIVEPSTSPEILIDGAQLTISMPYTSTNNIAANKGKHAIYYDPSDKLNPSGYFDPLEIDFAQNLDQLKKKMSEHLKPATQSKTSSDR